MLKKWDELPPLLRTPEVRPYFEILDRRRPALAVKRLFDLTAALVLIILLSPLMLGIAAAIALDSPGGVLFRQERVTRDGRIFNILKFRTMYRDAGRLGPAVTLEKDRRVTSMGRVLRGCRLDELPQLFNVLRGEMTFVGTRPENPQFVNSYTPQMYATLLLPAGITSEASIRFKDEAEMLGGSADPEADYIGILLPGKMKYNLDSLKNFSLSGEARTLWRTLLAAAGKKYPADRTDIRKTDPGQRGC